MTEHGTPAGYRREKRNGGKACPECRTAWRRHWHEQKRQKRATLEKGPT